MQAELRALPANVDAERFVLGSILLEDGVYSQAAAVLEPEDFSLRSHQVIFRRMISLRKRGEHIDRVTVANELMKFNELEESGGLSYLISLDDGLPEIPRVDHYAEIVRKKSALRKLFYAAENLRSRALLGEEEPEEIISASAQNLRDLYEGGASEAETVEEIIEESGGIEKFLEEAPGIPTLWPPVNHYMSGWRPGELYIIAARPSMGKSAFAQTAVWGCACRGVTSAFYSAEMDKRSCVIRFLSYLTGIPYSTIASNEMVKSERARVNEARLELNSRPLRIVACGGRTVMAIRSHAERLKSKFGLGFMAFDYLGMLRLPDDAKNRNHALGDAAKEFKLIASQLKIPVMLLVQLNRKAEERSDHRPMLSDLRDSGELEEHADFVGLLHRPGYYAKEDPSLRLIGELNIAKQRNGETPIVQMIYRGERFRWEAEERHAEDGY